MMVSREEQTDPVILKDRDNPGGENARALRGLGDEHPETLETIY